MPFDGQEFDFNDKILRTLAAAQELISTPNRWCRRQLESRGRHCAVGAIYKVCSGKMWDYEGRLLGETKIERETRTWLQHALPAGHYGDVPLFNDAKKHRDVMALYERAKAMRRATLMEKVRA